MCRLASPFSSEVTLGCLPLFVWLRRVIEWTSFQAIGMSTSLPLRTRMPAAVMTWGRTIIPTSNPSMKMIPICSRSVAGYGRGPIGARSGRQPASPGPIRQRTRSRSAGPACVNLHHGGASGDVAGVLPPIPLGPGCGRGGHALGLRPEAVAAPMRPCSRATMVSKPWLNRSCWSASRSATSSAAI